MNYMGRFQRNSQHFEGAPGIKTSKSSSKHSRKGDLSMDNVELDHRVNKACDKFSENLNIVTNEPSLAFYRIQEHVRKTLPQLVDKKHEVNQLKENIQGSCFDMEYGIRAVQDMTESASSFQKIQTQLKNAMFMKQQISYEKSRREQPSMYRRSMVRTQTVDIPVAEDDRQKEFSASVNISKGTPEESPAPRMRSSSLSESPNHYRQK